MKFSALFYVSIASLVLYGCNSDNQNDNGENGIDSTQLFTPARATEVTGIGKIEPENGIIALASNVSGVVVRQFKARGDSVKKGDPILQLDNVIEQSRYEQAASQVPSQRSQIEIAKESVREAETTVRYNREQLTTAQNLLTKGAETKENVDNLEQTLQKSEIELANRRLQVRQAEQRLNEIRQQSKVSEEEKKQRLLLAPEDGVLLDLYATVGSAVKQLDSYADFAATGPLIVRAEVDELFAHRVQTGQKAVIRLAGGDTLTFGTVAYVAPYLKKKSLFQEQASDLEDRRVREIRVAIPTNDHLLPNTKVECIIQL